MEAKQKIPAGTLYCCNICKTKPDQLSHHKSHLTTQKHLYKKKCIEQCINTRFFNIFYNKPNALQDIFVIISTLHVTKSSAITTEMMSFFQTVKQGDLIQSYSSRKSTLVEKGTTISDFIQYLSSKERTFYRQIQAMLA